MRGEFEKHIQDKFKDFEMDVSPGVFDAITAARSSKKRGIIWWNSKVWYGAAAVGLLAIGWYYFSSDKDQLTSDPVRVEQPTQHITADEEAGSMNSSNNGGETALTPDEGGASQEAESPYLASDDVTQDDAQIEAPVEETGQSVPSSPVVTDPNQVEQDPDPVITYPIDRPDITEEVENVVQTDDSQVEEEGNVNTPIDQEPEVETETEAIAMDQAGEETPYTRYCNPRSSRR